LLFGVNSRVTVDVETGPEAFSRLEQEWKTLLPRSGADTIFMTWDWQKTWWEWFGQGLRLCVVTIRDGKELVGLVPLYAEANATDQRTFRLAGGVELSDYLDLVVTADSREAQTYEVFWRWLTNDGGDSWSLLDLHNVPASSPSIRRLPALAEASGDFLVSLDMEEVCPVIALPSTWDEYLSSLSKKERHEIRRKLRKINREASFGHYYANDPASLHGDVQDFIALHRMSAGPKNVFMDEQKQGFFHALSEVALQNGWLRLAFLLVNGVKASAMLCFRYRDAFQVYNSGYNPELYPELSTGIVLLAYCVQDAIEDGLAFFDFLRGEEEYKYRFGAHRTEIYNLKVARRGSTNV
jgi:CelD/BcsL family acetyltransferase involved in cellulose biosynthesis